jgi:phosphoenolpyruvate carboxykinase (GTP)
LNEFKEVSVALNDIEFLKTKCTKENIDKLAHLANERLMKFIAKYIKLCNPDSIFVRDDSEKDAEYIREKAKELKEEIALKTEGHTVHFDGYYDQARDKKKTKFLLDQGKDLGPNINKKDKQEGLEEIAAILKDIMKGKEAFICFFSLGPVDSEFSIPAVQITDSAYVAHSEDILYRRGYSQFKKLKTNQEFFKFVHSAGELENAVSKNIDKRRVYIDLDSDIVYTTNSQYGGNTIGLKKLAMRLAINKASEEGWLTEHMFIVGINNENEEPTYFTGAYPSACGKTSTSMLKGENIIGDDIAYLRRVQNEVRAVNVERGMFGIIRDVNSQSDPLIWQALHAPGEVIFSNILITKNKEPYWLGKDEPIPEEGINHSGKWHKGKKDKEGNEITCSHKNARYTLRIKKLGNCDDNLDNSQGVKVSGIIYGGRDSDTSAPVEEAFSWEHGILTKAATLESETTAATLGEEGVRKFNPMSNLDFLSISIGRYIENNLKFKEGLTQTPSIFSVNYFLKDEDGNFLNGIHDKHIWLKWMNKRVKKQVEAIKTPSGYIPLYEDLKLLFKKILNKEYTLDQYNEQFKIRCQENIEKINRIMSIYKDQIPDTPKVLFEELEKQKERFMQLKKKHGEYVLPQKL